MNTISAAPIGGFIGLEPTVAAGRPLHPGAIALSTGRAALRLILESVRPERLLLPDYVCHAVLAPLRALDIPWRSYPVRHDLHPAALPSPAAGELLLVVNYFGIRCGFVRTAAERFGDRLIIDNTQAFYQPRCEGAWSFSSARKFFGVADGAYLYAPCAVIGPSVRASRCTRHLELRAMARLEEARAAFLEHELTLDERLLRPSESAERTLSRIDYAAVACRRRENFRLLDQALGRFNQLGSRLEPDAVPHSYPLLPRRSVDRAELIRRQIFVPTFWPELLDGTGAAAELARRLLPLPLDQRYDRNDMTAVAEIVRELITA